MMLFVHHALGAVALLASTSHAMSPSFVLSTANLGSFWDTHHSSASLVHAQLKDDLSSCPTTNYIIVSQRGAMVEDYAFRHHRQHSISALTDSHSLSTRYTSSDISLRHSDINNQFVKPLLEVLQSHCDSTVLPWEVVTKDALQMPGSHVIEIPFGSIRRSSPRDLEDEQQQIDARDETIARVLSALPSQDYTLIYYSTTHHSESVDVTQDEAAEYTMDDDPVAHQFNVELKRDLSADGSESFSHISATNNTLPDGPLFDRYQFTSPGLFMGFFAIVVLVSLFYIGVTGLSSLQVTYGAFDKEQGQLAAKKS